MSTIRFLSEMLEDVINEDITPPAGSVSISGNEGVQDIGVLVNTTIYGE